jgi:hypothetical protein
VLDLVESGKMKLQDVQFFVLDEADRLLDTGNQQSITKLHTKIKKFCAQAVMPDGYTGRPLQARWSRTHAFVPLYRVANTCAVVFGGHCRRRSCFRQPCTIQSSNSFLRRFSAFQLG